MHSRSAVGEQFLELTPGVGRHHAAAARRRCHPARAKCQIPADIGSLLDATNKALQAIPQDNLRTVVDEAAKAVGGLGPELSRIVDGSTALAIEAGKTVDPITQLIDQSPPVLDSQVQTADSIATWAQRMAVDHRSAQGAGRRLRGSAQPGRAGAGGRQSAVRPGRARLAGAAGQSGESRRYRGDLPQRSRAVAGAFPQGTAVMSAITCRTPIPSRTTGASTSTSTSTSTCRRHATPDSCRSGSSGRQAIRTPPSGPPVSCTAGCRRTRTSMSVVCATFRVRPSRGSGRRRSSCAKATSSTSHSTTATTGRATPTPRSRAGCAAVCAGPRSAAAAAVRNRHRTTAGRRTAGCGARRRRTLRPGHRRLHRPGR